MTYEAQLPFNCDGWSIAYFRQADQAFLRWPASSDPIQRAYAVREAFAQWKGDKADCYLQNCGQFDFGKDTPLVYPGCKCSGLGRESTINLGSVFSDEVGTNFQLSDGTIIEDMGFVQASYRTEEDGRCIGFDSGPASAILRHIAIWGREWALWNWWGDPATNGVNKLLVEDFTITGGRVCVASENSGLGQNFTLRNGTIIGDASLSNCSSGNAVSNPETGGIFGIVHRGGTLRLTDVDFQVTGSSAVPRACAITDRGGNGGASAGKTNAITHRISVKLNPNGAKSYWDVDMSDPQNQKPLRYCGSGSREDGTLRMNF